MTIEANRKLGHDFFMAQDRLKGGPDPALCTSDYTAAIAGFPAMPREGHQQFAEAFYAAFPDLYHTVDDVIAEEDRMVVRFTLRGTHKGDFMGVPPTGKQIEVGAIAMMEVRDGKVANLHGVFDRMGLMQQLGVVPSE